MEWLALALWILVLLVALPAGGGAFAAPALGVQPVLAIAGLVLIVLFAVDGTAGFAWAAFGLGMAGAVTTGAGAAQLIAEERPGGPELGRAEERASVFAGAAWPLFATAGACSLLVALVADGTI